MKTDSFDWFKWAGIEDKPQRNDNSIFHEQKGNKVSKFFNISVASLVIEILTLLVAVLTSLYGFFK